MTNDIKELMDVLDYDPETGLFQWKATQRKGKAAGHQRSTRYVVIRFKKKLYCAHRLAWALHHGKWPEALVDHKDGNTFNNAISNLRLASVAENSRNRRVNKSSCTGLKGVNFSPSRRVITARIRYQGRNRYLGTFKTVELAHEFYCLAADMIHGEFSRHE